MGDHEPRVFLARLPLLGFILVLGAQTAAVLLSSPRHAEMAERIETLETSRAGAVDVQDSELRRIERDLHDGAQARLVALGMSLGMAEQKLDEDPERGGELLTEARAGAEQALRELRDLARGIHPPVLADRGLEAALSALANSTPLPVTLAVDVSPRPASAVESAAYFVVAEVLANAGRHARAERVTIHIVRIGDQLKLAIEDDGIGGADPDGPGLRGLRRRVAHEPDLAVVDIRLPPGYRDEGLRAALEARRRVPGTAVLVISQYVEQAYAEELLADRAGGHRLPPEGPRDARRRLPRGGSPCGRRRNRAGP